MVQSKGKVVDIVAGKASIAARLHLERGLAGLKSAEANLPLSPSELSNLRLLIERFSKELKDLPRPVLARRTKKAAPASAKAKPIEPKSKKELRAELEKRQRIAIAKAEAEIQEVHRKSGFNTHLRRLPGSFEGGKK